ncbi:hypothetical protein EDD22DRAFT_960948 [Suillus occidentalis]|nr:hypothetical protein EDD22DRAFT_960948 [Suillus occidentalis]
MYDATVKFTAAAVLLYRHTLLVLMSDLIYSIKVFLQQANFRRVGAHIMPRAHTNEGPVLRGFAVPLREPLPPLSPDVEFHDPPRISDSAVEQDMLDYGFLTGEDLDIMTHGSALPNLGPNFHSPEALLAAVDHFDAYNTATAAGGRPLTTHEAYHLPIDPEQCALDRQLAKVFDEVREEELQQVDQVDGDDLDVDIDVDADLRQPR